MAETDAKSVMVGPEEMAAFFNRSVKTWRRWVRTGRAPLPDQVIGAAWYYRRSMLNHLERTGKWPEGTTFRGRTAASRIAQSAAETQAG